MTRKQTRRLFFAFLLLALACPSPSQGWFFDDSRQASRVRKYIRNVWGITEVAKLSNDTVRAVLDATYDTPTLSYFRLVGLFIKADEMYAAIDEGKYDDALYTGYKAAFGIGFKGLLSTVGLGGAAIIAQAATAPIVWGLEHFLEGAKRGQVRKHLHAYFILRRAGFTLDNILNKGDEGGILTVSYSDDGWILDIACDPPECSRGHFRTGGRALGTDAATFYNMAQDFWNAAQARDAYRNDNAAVAQRVRELLEAASCSAPGFEPGSPCNTGRADKCGEWKCKKGLVQCVVDRDRSSTPEVCGDGIDNDCNGKTDCLDSSCAAEPSCQPCSNECSPPGVTRCAGSVTEETCGNYDSDVCLEWGADHTCPNGCGGDACQSGPCPGECSPDDIASCTTSCGSTGTKTCSTSCSWGSCIPPAEMCGDGIDQDCDGTDLACEPDGGPFAYVTQLGGVSVIDTSTDRVVAVVPVSGYLDGVAVDPTGRRVYVGGASSVSAIDTSTNAVVDEVTLAFPEGLAVHPSGRTLYATANYLHLIDTATMSIVDEVKVYYYPSGVAVDNAGEHVYVAHDFPSGVLSVIDTETNGVVETVRGLGWSAAAVAVAPDDRWVYVTGDNSGAFEVHDSVFVIDTVSRQVAGRVTVVGSRSLYAIAVHPAGTRLYVTDSRGLSENGTVWTIDSAAKTVIAAIPVRIAPQGIAVTPDGTKLYVVNLCRGPKMSPVSPPCHYEPSVVSVIDTSTDSVIGEVPVGKKPRAFGEFIARADRR